jgi:hypothetical protein
MRRCLAAGVLVFCAGAGSGEAAAQNYGAFGYSPSTKAYGWSYDYPSRSAAESTALANCGKQANDCIVALWFRNSCGALAIGSNGYGTAWASQRSGAENQAPAVCRRHTKDCAVKHWVCTTH